MATVPHFGDIELDNLSDYYEADYNYLGKSIAIDLNFEDITIEESDLQPTIVALNGLNKLIETAYAELTKSYQTNGPVKQYINRHMSGLNPEELATLFDAAPEGLNKELKMMNQLKLRRIGFYPEDTIGLVSMDFTIGYELTDDVIAIYFNNRLQLEDIALEN